MIAAKLAKPRNRSFFCQADFSVQCSFAVAARSNYGCPRFSMSQLMLDADRARGTLARQAGSALTTAQLPPLGAPSVKRSHLDGRPAGDGSLGPHASASSRLAASSTQKPPMCSLVSRYGPSVMRTVPPGCARSDLALLAGERPPTKILTPAATRR
jgi:hypothetical protein